MSFTELLRNARASRVSVLHRFLTNYDPRSPRVYGFVEGEPDRLFYRTYIEKLGISPSDIFIYDCNGKENVYRTYEDVITRYPSCVRVLFFVDKDVDDIVGRQWPTDPRIFVTRVYSIENYVICRAAMKKYFLDFVKLRRVEITLDSALDQFERELQNFYRLIRPVMAWIVFSRRSGGALNLNNVDLGNLFEMTDAGIRRRRAPNRFEYIRRVTQVNQVTPVWRQVRATCAELQRMPPKSFVRGKFEAWVFIHAAAQISDALRRVSIESGGSVAFSAQLSQTTFIQLLCPGVSPPEELAIFLGFHLAGGPTSREEKTQKRNPSSIRKRFKFLPKWD